MKYIGEKSLSSFIEGALKIIWWAMLVLAVCFTIAMVINLFDIKLGDPVTEAIANMNRAEIGGNVFLWFDFPQISNWPVAGKILAIIDIAACVVLSLIIIRKAQRLFANFKKDILFDTRNVQILSTISKLLIADAILFWSLGTLITSVLLLILCQIFRHGITLQEEHDFTV
jgi:hypothetical protein